MPPSKAPLVTFTSSTFGWSRRSCLAARRYMRGVLHACGVSEPVRPMRWPLSHTSSKSSTAPRTSASSSSCQRAGVLESRADTRSHPHGRADDRRLRPVDSALASRPTGTASNRPWRKSAVVSVLGGVGVYSHSPARSTACPAAIAFATCALSSSGGGAGATLTGSYACDDQVITRVLVDQTDPRTCLGIEAQQQMGVLHDQRLLGGPRSPGTDERQMDRQNGLCQQSQQHGTMWRRV